MQALPWMHGEISMYGTHAKIPSTPSVRSLLGFQALTSVSSCARALAAGLLVLSAWLTPSYSLNLNLEVVCQPSYPWSPSLG